jgi:hypothetical protein
MNSMLMPHSNVYEYFEWLIWKMCCVRRIFTSWKEIFSGFQEDFTIEN